MSGKNQKPRIKEHYIYKVEGNCVSAGASFAGAYVWGHARCHPDDVFDEDFGKALASARCNSKIARLRYKRAWKRYNETREALARADDDFDAACEYLANAYDLTKIARERESLLLDDGGRTQLEDAYGECCHDYF